MRRKNNAGLIWAVGGVAALVVGVGTWFVLSQMGPGSTASPDAAIVQQAQALVAGEMQLEGRARFAEEYRAQQVKPGVLLVQSSYTVSHQGKNYQYPWKAELAAQNGGYELRSLVVNNQRRELGSGHDQTVTTVAAGPGAEGPPRTRVLLRLRQKIALSAELWIDWRESFPRPPSSVKRSWFG